MRNDLGISTAYGTDDHVRTNPQPEVRGAAPTNVQTLSDERTADRRCGCRRTAPSCGVTGVGQAEARSTVSDDGPSRRAVTCGRRRSFISEGTTYEVRTNVLPVPAYHAASAAGKPASINYGRPDVAFLRRRRNSTEERMQQIGGHDESTTTMFRLY